MANFSLLVIGDNVEEQLKPHYFDLSEDGIQAI